MRQNTKKLGKHKRPIPISDLGIVGFEAVHLDYLATKMKEGVMLTPSLQAEKKTRKYEGSIVRKQMLGILLLVSIVPGIWYVGNWVHDQTTLGRKYDYFNGMKQSPAGVPIEPTTTRLPIVLPTFTASPAPPTSSPKPPSDFGVRVKLQATQTAQAIKK